MKACAIMFTLILVGGGWLSLLPMVEAKSQTLQGTVMTDGAAVPNGAVVSVFRSGIEIASTTTPVTTQGTYRVSLTNVSNGDVLSFKVEYGGLTYPADESRTLTAVDSEPTTLNLNTHAHTFTGVTKVGGAVTGSLLVKAFIANTMVASTTSGTDGTYTLRVPGAAGASIFFTVGSRKGDQEYSLSPGSSTTFDVEVSNHAPTTPVLTVGAYSTVAAVISNVSARDGDEYAGDTMTYTIVWGDGTSNSAVSGKVSNTTYAPSHTYAATGSYVVSFFANDTNGGSTSASTTLVYDNTAPTTTLTPSPASPNGDNGWYKTEAPTFTLAAIDSGVAGVASRSYRHTNESATQAYSSDVIVSEGDNTYNYWAADNAENVENTKYYRFRVDVTGPTGAVGALPEFTTASSIALVWNTTDSGGSGWASGDLYYKEPGATLWTLWLSGLTNTSASFTTMQDGVWSFYLRGRDVAGNQRAAPTSGTTSDASTIVNTAAVEATITPSAQMDRDGYWVERPTLNVTLNVNGTVHYAWNANTTGASYSAEAYIMGGEGITVLPGYGCNVLSAYGVSDGQTSGLEHYRVCVRYATDQAQFDGVNATIEASADDVRNAVFAHWVASNSSWAEWNASFEEFNTSLRLALVLEESNLTSTMADAWAGSNASIEAVNASIHIAMALQEENLTEFARAAWLHSNNTWAAYNQTFAAFDAALRLALVLEEANLTSLQRAEWSHSNDTWVAYNTSFNGLNASLHLALALMELNESTLNSAMWMHHNSTWEAYNATEESRYENATGRLYAMWRHTNDTWAAYNASFAAFNASLRLALVLSEANVTALIAGVDDSVNGVAIDIANLSDDVVGFNQSLQLALMLHDANLTNLVRSQWSHTNDTWAAYNATFIAFNDSFRLALIMQEANATGLVRASWLHRNSTWAGWNSTWASWNASFATFDQRLALALALAESNTTNMVRASWTGRNDTWAAWNATFVEYNLSNRALLLTVEDNITQAVNTAIGDTLLNSSIPDVIETALNGTTAYYADQVVSRLRIADENNLNALTTSFGTDLLEIRDNASKIRQWQEHQGSFEAQVEAFKFDLTRYALYGAVGVVLGLFWAILRGAREGKKAISRVLALAPSGVGFAQRAATATSSRVTSGRARQAVRAGGVGERRAPGGGSRSGGEQVGQRVR